MHDDIAKRKKNFKGNSPRAPEVLAPGPIAPPPVEDQNPVRMSIEELDKLKLLDAMQNAINEDPNEDSQIEIHITCNSDEERDDPDLGSSNGTITNENMDPLASMRDYLAEKIGADTLTKAS
jgi:hypothetical protein